MPIDANTANSEVALSALVSEFAQAADAARRQAKFGGMAVYGITVDYDQIPPDTPAHVALRNRAKDVPTAWTLTPPQLQTTEEAGRFLLRRHPCYRALLTDLRAAQPALSGEDQALTIPCATKIEIKKAGAPSS